MNLAHGIAGVALVCGAAFCCMCFVFLGESDIYDRRVARKVWTAFALMVASFAVGVFIFASGL